VREDEHTVYVGSLPWLTTEDDLAALFGPFGPVSAVRVTADAQTGRSRGYGFVGLPTPQHVKRAVSALDGHAFRGRPLIVSQARPRQGPR
jgi:RNA recognition motif-containing protein